MTTSLSTKVFRTALFMTAMAATMPQIRAQQTPPAPIRAITRYTLKTDRTGDMAAAIKEYNEILKKAKWDKPFTIWRSTTGPNEMLKVDNYQKWAELDATVAADPRLKDYRADLALANRRITESFVSSVRVIDIVNQQIYTPATETPKMILVWTAHVKLDKMQQAIDMEKNEYAPAVKSAGLHAYTFATARYGAPANEIRSTVALDNWAALDQGNAVREAMGDDKFRVFSEKMNSLLENYTYELYRFDPDLSYTPAK